MEVPAATLAVADDAAMAAFIEAHDVSATATAAPETTRGFDGNTFGAPLERLVRARRGVPPAPPTRLTVGR
jgi:hypothetical protein